MHFEYRDQFTSRILDTKPFVLGLGASSELTNTTRLIGQGGKVFVCYWQMGIVRSGGDTPHCNHKNNLDNYDFFQVTNF